MRWRELRWRDRHGQSLVEFALVGPLFLAVVFVVLEGGLMLNAQASLDSAAREGAREATICPNDQTFADRSQCDAPVRIAVLNHLGIVDQRRVSVVTCVPANTNPCATTANASVCQQAATGPYAGVPSGSVVEVDVYYLYDYYAGSLLGTAGPSTCMSTRARATAQ